MLAPDGYKRLQTELETAANPVHLVQNLPAVALDISNRPYTFAENLFGWQTLKFVFEPNQNSAKIIMNETPLQVGLDNIYRSSETAQGYEIRLRGYWADEGTFVVDYPYSLSGVMALGELGESEIRFAFAGDKVKVTAEQLVFGGEPIVVEGSR